MKLVHTTDYNCTDEGIDARATRLFIYAMENNDEFWRANSDDWDELNELLHELGYYSDGYVDAGAPFTRYSIDTMGDFVIVEETSGYNI